MARLSSLPHPTSGAPAYVLDIQIAAWTRMVPIQLLNHATYHPSIYVPNRRR